MCSSIKLKSYAKINLFLDILNKRDDGYHNIKSVMQSISLYDELTLKVIEENSIIITCNDKSIPTDEKNTCYKAARIIKEKYNINNGIEINIDKNIPSEAGLAGGSGNCAAVIKGMDRLFNLNLSKKTMLDIGLMIGADVPFCLTGGTVLCEGVGEILTELNDFVWENIIVIKPDFSVSTKDAYNGLSSNDYHLYGDNKIVDYINNNLCEKASLSLANTLEISISKIYTDVNKIKDQLMQKGAISSLMTGSGSAIFGLYKDKESALEAYNSLKCLYKNIYLVRTTKEGVKWS